MTRVLIVSRTRIGQDHCIGGMQRDDGRAVRLCPAELVHGLPVDAPYHIGDVWEMDLETPRRVQPPHVEDVIVRSARRVASQTGLGRYLAARIEPWRGGPEATFDGALRFTISGRGYVPEATAVTGSVGFWVPEMDLVLEDGNVYRCSGAEWRRAVRYVGVSPADPVIPAGSLTRVSLSRVFAPEAGPRGYWLQLSGWYPDQV